MVDLLIIGILIIAVQSCHFNKSSRTNNKQYQCSENNDFCKNEITDSTVFCPVLWKELKDFMLQRDSVCDKGNIYNIWFAHLDDGCHIYMEDDYCYDSRFLNGYLLVENKMIAVLNSIQDSEYDYLDFIMLDDSIRNQIKLPLSDCASNMIEQSRLIKGQPTGFENENSFNGYFDGWKREYIILGEDSLVLVYNGPA